MKQFESVDKESPEKQTHLQAQLLLASSQEALLFNNMLKENSRTVSRDAQSNMLLHYSRFFTLFDRAGGNITPKFHLMYHAIFQISEYGNPRYFATYVDESFNRIIAAIARSCHRLTWADSIFKKISAIQQLDKRRLAGFRH
jgi:hypothetical protein